MPNPARIAADTESLRGLAIASGGKIALLGVPAPGTPRFVVELGYATAGSAAYPARRQERTRIVIDLPARYPFEPPRATVTTPILHPNVFLSGLVCLGAKWLPSEGMDLFVQRLARLVTFDPLLVNVHSAANREALAWYLAARARHPEAFPTDRVDVGGPAQGPARVQWREADRAVVACPGCGGKLRLPAGRRGTVRCPKCANEFEAAT
ncbi:MAG: hypothetical protein N2544_04400 [Burkholderiales bacterium]|nr:hypothetical protein [Burkholderiales bacterium]